MKSFVYAAVVVVLGALGAAEGKLRFPHPVALPRGAIHLTAGQKTSVGAAPSGSCNDIAFKHCWANFMLAIGGSLDIQADWNNPDNLLLTLDNLYARNGTQGLAAACRGFVNFHQCLGTSESACLNIGHVMQHGVTPEQGFFWLGTLASLHYQCGAGLLVTLQNWNCYQTAVFTQENAVQNILANFTDSVNNDPTNACSYGSTFLDSIYKIFTGACNNAVGWFECESARVGMAQALFYCPFRCTITGEVGLEEPSSHVEGHARSLPLKHQ